MIQQIQQMFPQGAPPEVQQMIKRMQALDPDSARQAFGATTMARKITADAADARHKAAQAEKDIMQARLEEVKAAVLEQGGPQAALYNSMVEQYGSDSPQANAVLQKMAGTTGAGALPSVPFAKLNPETQKAVDSAAWNYIISGHQPPARGGLYSQTMAYMQDVARENGMSVQDLMTASQDVKTRMQAKKSFEQRVLNISRAENVLNAELPVLQENMKKIDLSKYPALSHIDLWRLRQLGDPAVTMMDQSAKTVFNEFEGIVTGNVGGALNVQDVQQAKEDYYRVQTPQQMQAWIDNAHNIIDRAKSANDKTRKDWMGGINSVIGGRSPLQSGAGAQPQPQAAAAPVNLSAPNDAAARQSIEELTAKGVPARVGVGRPATDPKTKGAALPLKNEKGWTLHEDAHGNKAYVGPNNEIQEVK